MSDADEHPPYLYVIQRAEGTTLPPDREDGEDRAFLTSVEPSLLYSIVDRTGQELSIVERLTLRPASVSGALGFFNSGTGGPRYSSPY